MSRRRTYRCLALSLCLCTAACRSGADDLSPQPTLQLAVEKSGRLAARSRLSVHDTCGEQPPAADGSPHAACAPINPRLLRRFREVASDDASTPHPSAALVDLGRMLWFEKRFSRDQKISCDTCHDLESYGVDGLPTSLGAGGRRGRRNAPTVYNTAEHFALFWDGRAHDAAQQAAMPIVDPTEMASSNARVESFLRSEPEYRAHFARAFPDSDDPISMANVAASLAAFEGGLKTTSRWDDYLAGDPSALSPNEVEGLRIFLDVGCVTCHTGPQVGASSFQRTGAVEPWPNQDDLGRYEITKDPVDRMLFKVPTLKNVTRTGPWFHDGSSTTLADAVRRMGRYQLGVPLDDGQVDLLVQFLDALTGSLPEDYIKPPALPGLAQRGH